MKITEALKNEPSGLRLSLGGNDPKWLVYDNLTKEWVVYQRRYRAHNTIEVYRGDNEDAAILKLLWE